MGIEFCHKTKKSVHDPGHPVSYCSGNYIRLHTAYRGTRATLNSECVVLESSLFLNRVNTAAWDRRQARDSRDMWGLGRSGWARRWSVSPRPAPRRPPGHQHRASGRQVPKSFGFHLWPSFCDAGCRMVETVGPSRGLHGPGAGSGCRCGFLGRWRARHARRVFAELPPAYKAGDGSMRRSSRNSSRAYDHRWKITFHISTLFQATRAGIDARSHGASRTSKVTHKQSKEMA